MPEPKPDLFDATDTDEINRLAAKLAAWGLRHGECDVDDAVDWVLAHPHEPKLPRGKYGLNPTKHHVRKGAQYAADTFVPGIAPHTFDAAELADLETRVAGAGVRHERYLLAVIQLCEKFETFTPVVTGPLLAGLTGVSENSASKVLRLWSASRADGFFTKVTYDGVHGHGRVWHVNKHWRPRAQARVTHEPGCNRSASRCRCRVSQHGLSILSAGKIDNPQCDSAEEKFRKWARSLASGSGVTITDVCAALGVTRAAAAKLLRAHEGTEWLKAGTFEGGRRRTPQGWRQQGQTWFTR